MGDNIIFLFLYTNWAKNGYYGYYKMSEILCSSDLQP